MSDTVAKIRELLLSQSRAGRLKDLFDSIYGAAQTGAEAYGSANSPMAPEHTQRLSGLFADFTPVVGDVKSAYEGVQAAKQGDYLGAGLGALGALPMVPNLAGAITKHTYWPKIDPKLFMEEKAGKAKVSYTVSPEKREVDIASLRVPQAARKQGEGRRAMQELLNEVDAAGYSAKLGASPLDSKTKLQTLIDFYKSLGFEPSGRSINGVGDPEMIRKASQ